MNVKVKQNKISINEGDSLMDPISELVRALRCDGRSPAEISYALVTSGFSLAMETAPSTEHAIYLVSGALCSKSREFAKQNLAEGGEQADEIICDEEAELIDATPISDAVN